MLNHNLLLIEDNDLDARLITAALAKTAPKLRVQRAHDGEFGLQMIAESQPDMVLLDLSLPGLSGFQVLDRIRDDTVLTNTPVIICTNSDDNTDVQMSYSKQANAFVTKPASHAGYESLADSLAQFWFEKATLPT